MREKARIERICNLIKEIWSKCPDQRFLQLLINGGVIPNGNHWFVEDDEFEEVLKKTLQEGI